MAAGVLLPHPEHHSLRPKFEGNFCWWGLLGHEAHPGEKGLDICDMWLWGPLRMQLLHLIQQQKKADLNPSLMVKCHNRLACLGNQSDPSARCPPCPVTRLHLPQGQERTSRQRRDVRCPFLGLEATVTPSSQAAKCCCALSKCQLSASAPAVCSLQADLALAPSPWSPYGMAHSSQPSAHRPRLQKTGSQPGGNFKFPPGPADGHTRPVAADRCNAANLCRALQGAGR